jgi:hypothetical protein
VKSTPVAVGFVILAVIFLVAAVLYAIGMLQIFTSTTSGTHIKHAILFAVLAVASLIAANFTREKTV